MNIRERLKKYGAVAALLCGFISPAVASTPVMNKPLVNETALAYSNTYVLNMSSPMIDSLSFQAIYGSATIPTVSLNDGKQSTATITVVSNTALSTAAATNYLTVLTTKSITNAAVTINGITLTGGTHWLNDVTYSSWTARSIRDAINSYVPGIVATTGGASIVYTTATAPGTYGNNITFTSNSSSITINSPTFRGGQDNARISVNGVPLTANVDWYPGATVTATADAIAAAMRANTSIAAIVTSTSPSARAGVIVSTSIIAGTAANYSLISSTPAALSVSNTNTYYGGTDSAFAYGTGVITASNHQLTTGLPVVYSTGSNVTISPLVSGTTYYVAPITSSTFGLATTSTGAIAGSYVTFTSSSPSTTTHTFTVRTSTFTGTASFKYQASNDGTNWTDLTTPGASMTQATYVNPSTSTIVDLGNVNYGYIRVNVTGPSASTNQGAIYLKVIPNGKNTTK